MSKISATKQYCLQDGSRLMVSPVCDTNELPLPGASVTENNVDSSKAIEKVDLKSTIARPASFCRLINGTVSKADPSDGYAIQSDVKCLEALSTNHHLHESVEDILQFRSASTDTNGGNINTTNKIEDSDLPNSQVKCVYRCCSECIHKVHLLVKQFVMNCWKADGCCARLENVHDLVASCTLRMLVVVAQFGVSKNTEI